MPISAPPPSWASIKNKPNTLTGFGITDAFANGQTLQNVTRTAGTTYTNTTGRAITLMLYGYINNTSSGGWTLTVSGSLISSTQGAAGGIGMANQVSMSPIIPPGATYVIGNATVTAWELR